MLGAVPVCWVLLPVASAAGGGGAEEFPPAELPPPEPVVPGAGPPEEVAVDGLAPDHGNPVPVVELAAGLVAFAPSSSLSCLI